MVSINNFNVQSNVLGRTPKRTLHLLAIFSRIVNRCHLNACTCAPHGTPRKDHKIDSLQSKIYSMERKLTRATRNLGFQWKHLGSTLIWEWVSRYSYTHTGSVFIHKPNSFIDQYVQGTMVMAWVKPCVKVVGERAQI